MSDPRINMRNYSENAVFQRGCVFIGCWVKVRFQMRFLKKICLVGMIGCVMHQDRLNAYEKRDL